VTATWRVLTASARGALHDRRGLPNQDAVTSAEVGAAVVAAVADGHGGDRYVRSDVGAQLAVDVACAAVARAIDGQPDVALDRVLDALPTFVVDRWTALVRDDLASRPFDDAERERAGAPLDDDPVVAYGATLLVAIATAEGIGVLQLGDGDVVVGTAGGNMLVPVPSDDRLVAGQTTSLCLPTAIDDFRRAIVPDSVRPDFVLLASDGYGNSFADAGWREQVTADLRQRLARDGADVVQGDLPRWLTDSARAAGDDTTVAVLTRAIDDATLTAADLRGSAPTAPTPSTRAVPTAASPPPRSGARRPGAAPVGGRRPTGAIVAVGVVAALVGLGAGFAIGRAGDSGGSGATASSTEPSSTSSAPTPTVPSSVQVVGPNGATIVFVPDPAQFDARIAATGASHSATTQLLVGDDVWSVNKGAVSVRTGGRSVPVGIADDFEAASLVYAGGYIWAIDAEEGHMAAIDPATQKLLENGVKRIQNPFGNQPEQTQASS
jgi:serine/threonine protein phosphatase PrpC